MCGGEENGGLDQAHVSYSGSASEQNIAEMIVDPSASRQPTAFQLTLDCNKAGMGNVDKERVEAIIRGAGEGTPFLLNEQRLVEGREKQLRELKRKSSLFTQLLGGERNAAQRKQWELKVSKIEQELEATRRLGTYIHLDMDMFYAAVEIKKHPEYATIPLAIGTRTRLQTANYVARGRGVRCSMPGFLALKICPNLLILPPDFDSYNEESNTVRRIVAEYDPNYISFGLDELTLEVSAYIERFEGTKTAEDVASELRVRVFGETKLTASAGIGPTAALAKIASNINKPNGQHDLNLHTREDVMTYVRDLGLRSVPGVGKVTEALLKGLGITTLGDIHDRRVELCYILHNNLFRFLLGASIGIMQWPDAATAANTENCEGATGEQRKAISSERSITTPRTKEGMQEMVDTVFNGAYEEMRKSEMMCRRISLRIRWASYRYQQYTKSLIQYSDDSATLRRAVDGLLLPHAAKYSEISLLGVRFLDLISAKVFHMKRKGGNQLSISQFIRPKKLGEGTATTGIKRERTTEPKQVVGVNLSSDDEDENDSVGLASSSTILVSTDKGTVESEVTIIE
ncbi:DNA polymerase IV, putative [Trypanosoma brucei gambiense DAL972]|uniref:DNA polymerase kappa n=1 Tax=Trypanosoma brucei gambiense (strain MHOM/CI/86/DAL972) TaxID=679716 RepID=D0A852_TRYB9|nr:DNA polymerase IV, putative [Trypanosoma brucei gambiense DAL972]CBH17853.1 DNA polymerase IV, putative [Trypanosoma brucei gambiense DAL972]|eukprot:XP_011780117.1 DNA polymerase IV, putative [Trypanosoma brucei gambiense DAL972]